MSGFPYFLHPPGTPANGAVLDLSTQAGSFCYASLLERRDGEWRIPRGEALRTAEECGTILRLLAGHGATRVDIAGDEPLLHPDLAALIRLAQDELGLPVRLFTHGLNPGLEAILETGVADLLIPVHGMDTAVLQEATGADLAARTATLDRLDARGFHYATRTAVFPWNYRSLPDIARHLVERSVYRHDFVLMNAGDLWTPDAPLPAGPRYRDLYPFLCEAISILEEAGVAAGIRNAPLCAVPGLEHALVGAMAGRHDPQGWMNVPGQGGATPEICAAPVPVNPGEPDPAYTYLEASGRLAAGIPVTGVRGAATRRVFTSHCTVCAARPACDGFDPRYLNACGDGEAIAWTRFAAKGVLPERRLENRAAFLVKRDAKAPMRALTRRMLHPRPPKPDAWVSVIVTCYNYGRFLEQAVLSALEQSWPHLDVIVVDDGSTDDTRAVCDRLVAAHPDRLRCIHQANSGQPAIPRNVGIAQARGELILCLDADDTLLPSFVAECVESMRRHPDASIVFTNRLDFGSVEGIFPLGDIAPAEILYGCGLSYCSLYRREVWDDVGGYRTNIPGSEDWDFWVAAIGHGHRPRHIARPLFRYRRNDDGLWAVEVKPKHREKHARIVLNNRVLYPPPIVREARALLEGTGRTGS